MTHQKFATPRTATPIEVRRATEADLPSIQQFIAETYGSEAAFKGPDRWRWQFIASPFRPLEDLGPSVWIAVSAGKVVGQIAVQDGCLWLDTERLNAGWIVDVMVHSAFRGLGLSHQIHDAILKERELLVTLTMAPATRRIAERAGCVTLGPTRRFILPCRLSSACVTRYLDHKAHDRPDRARILNPFVATRLGPATVATAGRAVASVRRLLRPRTAMEGFSAEEIHRFPETFDAFWKSAATEFPAIFERSSGFLNWRFCDSPKLSYRKFLLHGRDGALRGYLITRLALPIELPVGVIADVFARPGDTEALDALLSLANDVLAPEAEYLEAAASTPEWQAALRRAGFIATKTMRPTVVATNAAVRARIAAMPDDWHFTKADHDWDQVHPV
jgi:GNAT superfamily N-acetyltransferase